MDKFKFNFLSRGQLGSLSIDNFFFFDSKCYHAISYFGYLNFGNYCSNVQRKSSKKSSASESTGVLLSNI